MEKELIKFDSLLKDVNKEDYSGMEHLDIKLDKILDSQARLEERVNHNDNLTRELKDKLEPIIISHHFSVRLIKWSTPFVLAIFGFLLKKYL